MKTMLRLAGGLAISAVLLWLVFRNVDLAAVVERIQVVPVGGVLGFVATVFIAQFARVYRWDLLTRPVARLPFGEQARIGFVGMAAIAFVPLRLGELARPYLFKKASGAPMSSGLGAVVVERVTDGLLVTFTFFAMLVLLPARYEVAQSIRYGAYAALLIFGGGFVVLVAALLWHGRVHALVSAVGNRVQPRLTERLLEILDAFVLGLQALPGIRSAMTLMSLTFGIWAIQAVGFYVVMVGFGWDVPFMTAVILQCILVFGIMIPAGPGFLGTYQGAIMAALAIFGVGATDAVAYGLIVYPLNMLVLVLCALPYVFGGVDWSGVLNAGVAEETGQ